MSTDSLHDQTHWAPARRRGPLPTFYYHGHFLEMLDFVAQHYSHALADAHWRFIDEFHRLPKHAQCLYVRLVNRKGRVFAANRLRYPELGNIRGLLDLLGEQLWVGVPDDAHYRDVLGHLTKAEIGNVLRPMFAGMSRAMKKDQLIQFALQNCSPANFMKRLQSDRVLVQRRVQESQYLMFLYFGKVQDGLSQFTMRDLGLVRTNEAAGGYEPRFPERAAAQESFFYASLLHGLNSSGPVDLVRLAEETGSWPEANFSTSAALRDELAYTLGRKLEQAGELERARHIHEIGESVACTERSIRLLLAANRRDEAEQRLLTSLERPRSEAEQLMAEDLYARKFEKKRTSTLTDELRAAETIEIDEAASGSPERAAIEYFERQGVRAYRTENLLWRTFFGLLFWDELFGDENAAAHSPFEALPAALANGSFHARQADRIEQRLAALDDPSSLKKYLLKTSTENYGRRNGVFRWRRSILEALFAFVGCADSAAVQKILRRFCSDYDNVRYGYPDLMLVDGNGVRFVEIKSDGDQLRPNQLLRQKQLREAGFRSDVVRVRWVLDPDQEYVVVDVETTGGRGEQHRVTEIGAVKVRNGRVVADFQTLLNPQRPIPPGITRLTGISEPMVASAPVFADIADEFEKFMLGAIFVAHNVEFDYQFIAREFKRIGRRFRYPKLCTCSAMRKLYPGQKSYSLAALCENFDIDLRNHHRAMCDAEAAAQLLLLINEKRALQQA